MALKRSMLLGIVIGALLGFFAFGFLAMPYVLSHTVKNAQPCDLFVVGPKRPVVEGFQHQLCWMKVDFPFDQNRQLSFFICPTPYTVSVQGFTGDINADVAKMMYDRCQRLQSFNPYEKNVEEVNGS